MRKPSLALPFALALLVSSAKPSFPAETMAWKQPYTGHNWTVIPGETRTFFLNQQGYRTPGATYTVSDGATVVSSTNGYVSVTAPATGSPCTVTRLAGEFDYQFGSATSFTVTATATDSGLKATQTVFVCNPSIVMNNGPDQRLGLFVNQPFLIHNFLTGSVNKAVKWAITANPGGHGALSDTDNRDTVFTASAAGRYVVTATSVADPKKNSSTIIDLPDDTPLPAGLTPQGTEPFNCGVDRNLKGKVYDVGIGQPLQSFAAVPFARLSPGSMIRFHQSPSAAPDVLHEGMNFGTSGTQAQGIVLCGVPNAAGILPALDGVDAVLYGNQNDYVAGFGLLTVWNHDQHVSHLTLAGLTVQNVNSSFRYTAGAHNLPWGTNPATPTSRGGFVEGIGFYDSYDNTAADSDLSIIGVKISNVSQPIYSKTATRTFVEGNWIYNWGTELPGAGAYIHGMYLNGSDSIVQFNHISNANPSLAGNGGLFKSRATYEFVSYNWLDGNDRGATSRVYDFVDNEDTCLSAPEQFWQYFCNGYTKTAASKVSMDQLAANNEVRHTQDFLIGNLSTSLGAGGIFHFFADHNLSPAQHGAGKMPRVGTQWIIANTHVQLTGPGAVDGSAACFDQYDNILDDLIEAPRQIVFNTICWASSPTVGMTILRPRFGMLSATRLVMRSNTGTNTQKSGGGAWPASEPSQNPTLYTDHDNLPQHVSGFGADRSALPNLTAARPFDPQTFATLPAFKGDPLPADLRGIVVRFNAANLGLYNPRANVIDATHGGLVGSDDTAAH